MNEFSRISISQVGDVHVLQITIADLSSREIVQGLDEELSDYARSHQPAKMVLDFSTVRFINSEMLSTMIRVRKLVQGQGGTVEMRHLSHPVRDVFRVTKLDRLFPIADDSKGAASAF